MSEPFWRKDAARTASELHSGTGLAVVSSFSRVLGVEYKVGAVRVPADFRGTPGAWLEAFPPAREQRR